MYDQTTPSMSTPITTSLLKICSLYGIEGRVYYDFAASLGWKKKSHKIALM